MKRARAQGKHLGRPTLPGATRAAIIEQSKTGVSRRAIARKLGIGDATVRRVLGVLAA
jgi:DNA invertase Pin-like site-specific DNA recombinase